MSIYKYNTIIAETDKAWLLQFKPINDVSEHWICFSLPFDQLNPINKWVPKSLCKMKDKNISIPDYFRAKIFPHFEYINQIDYKKSKLSLFEYSWSFMVKENKTDIVMGDGYGNHPDGHFYGSVDGDYLGG